MTKVDRSLKPSLDDGLDKSHRRAARGEEQVYFSELLVMAYTCVDAKILLSAMGCPEVEKIVTLLVGYDSSVDCIPHSFECCSQRGAVGTVYPAPSVAGK